MTAHDTEGPAWSKALAEARVERDDLVGAGRLLPFLAIYWLAVGAYDVAASFSEPNPQLSGNLAFRFAGGLVLVALWATYRRIGRRGLDLLPELIAVTCVTCALGMAVFGGGGSDRYPSAVFLLLPIVRSFVPRPFRQALVRGLASGAAIVSLFGLVCALFPGVAAAAAAERVLVLSILAMFLLGTPFAALVGSYLWAFRQAMYETSGFGRYQLRRRLGAGGMGEVWVAWHATMKREVAVKILGRLGEAARFGGSGSSSADGARRFEREILATAALSHPNTVRIFDHGVTDDGIPYYTMELLNGASVGQIVRAGGPIAPGRALRIARQAARALAEAHRKGIIHRDIKPDNLVVADAGGEPDFVKVLDFGIARFGESSGPRGARRTSSEGGVGGNTTVTVVGSVVGTPAYMPPEIASGAPADARSDVYSLGATLYFALTGTPPVEATSAQAVIDAHLRGLETPSERLGRALPADVEALVMRCLSGHPASRFASAEDVVRAIDACAVPDEPERIPQVVGSGDSASNSTIELTAGGLPPLHPVR